MAQEDELPPKKKSKFKWIILLILLLLIGGGGFGAWKLGFLDRFLPAGLIGGGTEEAQSQAKVVQPPASNPLIFRLDPFLVNLSDPLGRSYIEISVEVEVIASSVVKELQVHTPRIRDAMILLLSSKTETELASAEGKIRLKNEMLDRINQVLGGAKVTNVFFNNLLIFRGN